LVAVHFLGQLKSVHQRSQGFEQVNTYRTVDKLERQAYICAASHSIARYLLLVWWLGQEVDNAIYDLLLKYSVLDLGELKDNTDQARKVAFCIHANLLALI